MVRTHQTMIVPSLLLFVMHCVVSCTSSGSPLLVRAALEPNTACASADEVEAGGAPRVCIDDGCLVGTLRDGMAGEQFEAFLGIPFAQPPVGELRFAVSNGFGDRKVVLIIMV